MPKKSDFEFKMLYQLQTHLRRQWLTVWMRGITALGNGGILWVVLCLLCLSRQRTRFSGMAGLLALLLSAALINGLLKHLTKRKRPFEQHTDLTILIRRPKDFSFPSGHTSGSFATATVFLETLPHWFGITTLILAALIGFSRLYLGVHYPSDVLCGMLLGIGLGLTALYLLPILLQG